MTEKTHHNFTVVPDEHAEKIKQKGITVTVDTKKNAEKNLELFLDFETQNYWVPG